jgi:serine/threonine protein kinase
MSRPLPVPDDVGKWVLCDFGQAEFGKEEYVRTAMPDQFRAPEILLGISWNNKIDIWAIGMLVSDMISDRANAFLEQSAILTWTRHGIYWKGNACSAVLKTENRQHQVTSRR